MAFLVIPAGHWRTYLFLWPLRGKDDHGRRCKGGYFCRASRNGMCLNWATFLVELAIKNRVSNCPAYGGLRCPSEVLSLRWSDVKWADNEILVQSPKGEKYGKGVRKLPIFKELREPLQRAQAAARKDTVYVVYHYRDSNNANLRTQLTRLLKKLGITQWLRLFHNLRASRETEFLEKFPIQVVTAWLGNSPQIALQHYLQTTKEHFDRALTEDTEL